MAMQNTYSRFSRGNNSISVGVGVCVWGGGGVRISTILAIFSGGKFYFGNS